MPRSRILIVEDSRTQADWLRQVLEREGYAADVAQDGREAIRRVRTAPPDLVLLDMILPDMSGLDVLRIIKARSEEHFIPVILLSVRSDLESRVTGLRLGADDFLAKPFADAEIQARAAAMLRIKSLQDQLHAAKAQLEKLSITDGLTGLYNHRHFEERLADEFRRAQRYADPLGLIMLDLDHFKDVNDRYGHPFGDVVLRGTAELVRGSVRDMDVCARYGGEEFAIILPKTNGQGAVAVAERICGALRERTYVVDHDSGSGDAGGAKVVLRVTGSIGVASYPPEDATSAQLLVKFADDALYAAKRQGRNALCAHEPSRVRCEAGGRDMRPVPHDG